MSVSFIIFFASTPSNSNPPTALITPNGDSSMFRPTLLFTIPLLRGEHVASLCKLDIFYRFYQNNPSVRATVRSRRSLPLTFARCLSTFVRAFAPDFHPFLRFSSRFCFFNNINVGVLLVVDVVVVPLRTSIFLVIVVVVVRTARNHRGCCFLLPSTKKRHQPRLVRHRVVDSSGGSDGTLFAFSLFLSVPRLKRRTEHSVRS